MAGPKIVKRYANRKLYDTERSCYVTLDDISLMIKAGDEVRVIDNKSGEDLTSVTLAQIIFEAEKKKSFMPMGLLRELIQNKGETLTEYYHSQVVDKVQAKASDIADSAQAHAHDIKEKADKLREDLGDRIEGVWRKGEKEAVTPVLKAFDDLQRSVEERVKDGVGLVGRELEQLRTRLTELEERLERQDD